MTDLTKLNVSKRKSFAHTMVKRKYSWEIVYLKPNLVVSVERQQMTLRRLAWVVKIKDIVYGYLVNVNRCAVNLRRKKHVIRRKAKTKRFVSGLRSLIRVLDVSQRVFVADRSSLNVDISQCCMLSTSAP